MGCCKFWNCLEHPKSLVDLTEILKVDLLSKDSEYSDGNSILGNRPWHFNMVKVAFEFSKNQATQS